MKKKIILIMNLDLYINNYIYIYYKLYIYNICQ